MTGGEKVAFKKKHHYMIEFTVHYNQEPKIINGVSTEVKNPTDCNDEVIIRYQAKKKKYFISLTKFREIPEVYMP